MDAYAAEFTITPEAGHGSCSICSLQAARTATPIWHGHRHLFSRV